MRNRRSGIKNNRFFCKIKSYIDFFILFKVLYKSIVISLTIKTVLTVFQIVEAILAKIIIDQIALFPIKYKYVIVLIILIALVNIISQVLDIKNNIRNIKINYKITSLLNSQIIKKLKMIKLENLENPEIYNLIKRLDDNLSSGGLSIVNAVLQLISLPLAIIMYSIVLGNIKWYFPLIVICMSIPYFFVVTKKGMDEYYLSVQQSTNNRKLTYLYDLMISRNAIKEIKIYKLANYLLEKIKQIRDKLWKEKFALLLKHTIWLVFISILKYTALGICLLITCLEINKGNIGIGNIVLAISAVKSIIENMSAILGAFGELNTNYYNLIDLKKYQSFTETKKTKKQKINNINIKFDKVFFKYPRNKSYALCNINTSIKRGEKIALVGENGSGKSTFVHLLLGMYTVNKGSISIDGNKLENVIYDLRKKTACVFQDFIRFQFSIKENILLDNSKIDEYEKKLENIDDAFYLSFKAKENTKIGQFDYEGIDLSGGQWQRIAIYRALMKSNVEMMILDEPTAKLDPCIESRIYEEFAALTEGKTVILISHRLSATKLCDKILVFEKGIIVEEGNHDTLIQKKGKYYKMFMTQQSLYI